MLEVIALPFVFIIWAAIMAGTMLVFLFLSPAGWAILLAYWLLKKYCPIRIHICKCTTKCAC